MALDNTPGDAPMVGLFVTCLANLLRPSVGFAAVKLLQAAGCRVTVPPQSCCGQPAYNSGDYAGARAVARRTIEAFGDCDYVVGASGSCMATIRNDFPVLFADDPAWAPRARAVAEKSFELMSFLHDVRGCERVSTRYPGVATYHDSCSGLRGLDVKHQPRALLAGVEALTLVEMPETETCCGFGGTFCVKYPDISMRLVDDKVASIAQSGADTLLGGDLGCLLNIAGRLARTGKRVRVFHVAEVLAGMADGPGIETVERR